MLVSLLNFYSKWFSSPYNNLMAHITILLSLLILCYLVDFVTKRFLLRGLKYLSEKTKSSWDDELLKTNLFDRLAHIAPALVIYIAVPAIYSDFPMIMSSVHSLCKAYILLIGILVLDSALMVLEPLLQQSFLGKNIAFRSYIQLAKLIIYIVGAIGILSILMNKSPVVFFSGLGALTAVLMLVFKDTILGFVASIQLSANKMVMVGDWIEMPEFGADGDVIEVGLTSVKVQNWDKTISTVPTHNLVSHSFKNWRGMARSGGRRIKRSITIDMNTVKFCTEEMIKKFKKIHFLFQYIQDKDIEIKTFNKENDIDTSQSGNGRQLTNLGMFRAYLREYLKHHPKIHQNMTFLVRHKQPTEKGLPIELYVFSNDQNWVNYEGIQADIFDHILAILPEFELAAFQLATGHDFRSLR